MNAAQGPGRYTQKDWYVIILFLDKLARATRKTSRVSAARKEKIMASFEAYDPDIVIDALNAYINMEIPSASGGRGMNEKYVLGIMRNKQAAKDNGGESGGKYSGRAGGKAGKGAGDGGEDEGARLRRLAGDAAGGDLECDF